MKRHTALCDTCGWAATTPSEERSDYLFKQHKCAEQLRDELTRARSNRGVGFWHLYDAEAFAALRQAQTGRRYCVSSDPTALRSHAIHYVLEGAETDGQE